MHSAFQVAAGTKVVGTSNITYPLSASSSLLKSEMPSKYLLVSLPVGVFDSSDRDDSLSSLAATVSPDNGRTLPFNIPEFKIGTLDALVQQADDLTKLESSCKAVVAKVADSLRSILDGDEDKIDQQKMVNDSTQPTLPLATQG